jgi:protein-L-isoaspartate(D-aspartate) O-methyltransferase
MKDRREAVASMLLRLRAMGLPHRLMAAIESVPRQNFVPVMYLDDSYGSGTLPIECGQVMTGPDQVARTVLELAPEEGSRTLELGTGTGYQTALLARLSAKVTSLERYRTLVDKATLRLEALKLENAAIELADGQKGMPGHVFDRIIANCAYPQTPLHLVDQLASGGVAIVPVGPPDGVQVLTRISKAGSRHEVRPLFEVRMQPFWPGISRAI